MSVQTLPRPHLFQTEPAPHLEMMVVYENALTRLWAEGVCQHMEEELSAHFALSCTWCGFDDLDNPDIALQATSAARNADLIVFSTRASTSPSAVLQMWVESWIALKSIKESALVALINQTGPERQMGAPIRTYLQNTARRAGMDFLAHVINGFTGLDSTIPLQHGGATRMSVISQPAG